MKYCLSVLISFLFFSGFYAQTRKPKPAVKDSISSEAFMRVIDETLNAYYADFANQSNFDSIINALEYEPNTIPQVSDEVYCQRLEKMNEMTPFHLDCNPISLSTIRFFASKKGQWCRL